MGDDLGDGGRGRCRGEMGDDLGDGGRGRCRCRGLALGRGVTVFEVATLLEVPVGRAQEVVDVGELELGLLVRDDVGNVETRYYANFLPHIEFVFVPDVPEEDAWVTG